jgi:radical SAM protein with 4Fe4S-binding SPASM domain
MSYCNHPWSGLEIETDGTIRPCCKFRSDLFPNWPTFNINDSISNYLNSDALKNLQNQFSNNIKPDACVRCWKDESAGFKSKRQIDLERWGKTDKEIKFLTLPLGNHCNLKCRICGPSNSTSWIKEWYDLTGTKVPVQSWHKNINIINELIEISKNCLEINFHGGEPFLLDNTEHTLMIRELSKSSSAQNIRIHYNSNASVMPSDNLWEYWAKFKEVEVQLSIDDFGKRFEYNRYPASWEEVKKNLLLYKEKTNEFDNFQIAISTTVSVFTVYYLDEFFYEMLKLGMPKPWLGRLHDPIYYRASIFKPEIKEIIKEKLLTSKNQAVTNCLNWLQDDDSALWEEFLTNIKKHDSYRQQNFVDCFPELAKIAKIR